MPSKAWYYTYGGLSIPTGLIVGLKDGVTYDDDWVLFSDADGYWLRGTDDDGTVASTGSRSSLSVGSGSGGGHVGGQSPNIIHRGYSAYSCTGGNCYSPSNYTGSRGSHSGHIVTVSYAPSACTLTLIQAVVDTLVPEGAIMFSDADNSSQQLFSTFNSHGGFLKAGSAVSVADEVKSVTSVGSKSYSHNHEVSESHDAWGITATYTSLGSAGPSHSHASSSLNVTNNMARCYLRAFEIIERSRIQGLIGMWNQPGLPDRWSLVAQMTDKYLIFAADGDGTTAGDDTVDFNGALGNSAHSHSPSGSDDDPETGIPHSGSISHNHSFSSSGASYQPERYYMKFVKFDG